MKDFHRYTILDVMKDVDSSENGLTEEQAKDRRDKYGYNELVEKKKKGIMAVFFEQFTDFLVLILLASALVSAFFKEFESTILIVVVVTINAILGTVQHIKAEASLNSLKKLSAPITKVIRAGVKLEIPSNELTIGDIVSLETGDYISADGRIIESNALKINESSLTGESDSVEKIVTQIDKDDVALGDRINMAYSGSFVTYGRGLMIVTSIGMDTEIGKIATLLETATEKKTPLQENLDNFSKKLGVIIIAICAVIFTINTVRGDSIGDSFMFAVSLAVAAIPEALSSIVTIVLAIGTQKMAKQNAIIRKLHAVESLGAISVICSDKTGTLTQNKMTVKKLYLGESFLDADKLNLNSKCDKMLFYSSVLCNDAVYDNDNNKELGDPTEVALVKIVDFYNMDELQIRREYPRIGEIPFDSDRKLMSTVHYYENNKIMMTKGAVDVLLNKVDSIYTNTGARKITDEDKENIKKANEELSENGLRVLAFAFKKIEEDVDITIKDENSLIFVGLISMIDPPRVESKVAVSECIKAGIKPVMITGDHKITASAIAKEIGILTEGDIAIEGSEIDKMSDEELKDRVENISVYARVSPEHKIRIVKAWQDKGSIVSMTGDGVNDAPALKQANIGVAMGITGTEVSKDASSMILTDDNFSTIVKAISTGRNIYENIKNSIKFLLSGNTAGIVVVLIAMLLALPAPFASVHLLFINLITDSLPAIAIGIEPHSNEFMKNKPRNSKESILTWKFIVEVLVEGLLIGFVTLIAFYIGLETSKEVGATMAFSTLCLARLLHGINCRSKKSIFKVGILTNVYVLYALLTGVVLLSGVLFIPQLMSAFKTVQLQVGGYIQVLELALLPLIVIQLFKAIFWDRK